MFVIADGVLADCPYRCACSKNVVQTPVQRGRIRVTSSSDASPPPRLHGMRLHQSVSSLKGSDGFMMNSRMNPAEATDMPTDTGHLRVCVERFAHSRLR